MSNRRSPTKRTPLEIVVDATEGFIPFGARIWSFDGDLMRLRFLFFKTPMR